MDIRDGAWGPLRAFIAEFVVAAWREACGGSPVLFGGRRAGHDVLDDAMLIDAKVLLPMTASERADWPGHVWKVARHGHTLYDLAKTTHVALVLLPSDMNFHLNHADGKATVSATVEGSEIFLIDVAEFNDLLDPATAVVEGWRYLFIEGDWLADRRVQ